MRIAGRDTELLGIDRANEAHNSIAAAETGIGARVIAALPEHSALVLEFIEGTRLHADDLRAGGDRLSQVAEACKRLHAGRPFLLEFDMFDLQRRYLATVRERGFRLPDRYDEFEPRIRAMEAGDARASGAARPVQQRPARGELHRHGRRPAPHRLRVLGEQRAVVRARQLVERVEAERRAARGARHRVLRRAVSRQDRARASLGRDREVRLDALGLDPGRRLDASSSTTGRGAWRNTSGPPRNSTARSSINCS